MKRERSPGGGRKPYRQAIDSYRTMVWYRAVSNAAGRQSKGLERLYPPGGRTDYDPRIASSSTWKRYRKGEVTPTKRLAGARYPTIVQRVEDDHPGTAAWFDHPLWELLSPAPSSALVDAHAARLPKKALREILEGHYVAPHSWRPMGSKSELRGKPLPPPPGTDLTEEDLDYLSVGNTRQRKPYLLRPTIRSIDALAALFALLIKAESHCDRPRHYRETRGPHEATSWAALLSIYSWVDALEEPPYDEDPLACVAEVLKHSASSISGIHG